MSQPWQSPPLSVSIESGEVHLWIAELRDQRNHIRFEGYLSSAEQLRAGAFLDEKARETYIRSRGILRDILSRYLPLSPSSIPIEAGSRSKPRLRDAGLDLRFSVSHSHEFAIFAVTLGIEVGIDMERIDKALCSDSTAEPFLSEDELRRFLALDPRSKEEAFFTAWTRKEAYAKCRGQGLLGDVKLVETGFEQAEVVVDGVFLTSLNAAEGYCAALAIEAQPTFIKCWRWPPV